MLIGLVGKKGSGKSTTATMLCTCYNMVEYSISEPLKQICTILGAPAESVYGTQIQKEEIISELGMSGRRLMQKLGTDFFRTQFRKCIPEFNMEGFSTPWVLLLDRFIKKTERNIVVSDVRFLDEADTIKANGGILVRIVGNVPDDDIHASEQELHAIHCDVTLDNTGTLEDLAERIITMDLMNGFFSN